MNLSDISKLVSRFAPLLGSVITDTNPIVGLIMMALANMFGTTSNPDQLFNAITHDPDLKLKLQKLEQEHYEVLNKNQIDDRINARNREEKIIELTGKRDHILDFISLLIIIGFFTMCAVNYFIKLEDDRIIMMLIGQLSSGFMMCLSYYFGSSNK